MFGEYESEYVGPGDPLKALYLWCLNMTSVGICWGGVVVFVGVRAEALVLNVPKPDVVDD